MESAVLLHWEIRDPLGEGTCKDPDSLFDGRCTFALVDPDSNQPTTGRVSRENESIEVLVC